MEWPPPQKPRRNQMHGVKLLGQRLMVRDFDRQVTELQICVAVLNGIKAPHGNVLLCDPFPAPRPGPVCSAFESEGAPLFHDGDHLSGHGNPTLYPSFRDFLLEHVQ
jgi:hypothetical protein